MWLKKRAQTILKETERVKYATIITTADKTSIQHLPLHPTHCIHRISFTIICRALEYTFAYGTEVEPKTEQHQGMVDTLDLNQENGFVAYYILCTLCAIKLKLTYSDPNGAFKVNEIFKEIFTSSTSTVSFHGCMGIQTQTSCVLV